MKVKVRRVRPAYHYESEIYQSVEIYQAKSRILSWYYWGRVTTAISLLLQHTGQPRGGQVLDLGCGSGMTLPTIQKYFDRVTAADTYIDHAAKVARLEGLAGLEVMRTDGRALPFRDESFDTVLLLDILEHVEGDKEVLLDECHRVMKRNGHVVCSFPVEVGPVVLLRQTGRRLFGLEGNRQGAVETLKHAAGRGKPERPEGDGEGTSHDEAHRGYDYKRDLAEVTRRFERVASSPVPFRHFGFLSPAYVLVARKIAA